MSYRPTSREAELLEKLALQVGQQRFEFPLLHPPLERLERRMAHFNQYHVYKRVCDGTGKKMLSRFTPQLPFPVYDNEYWLGDKWDAVTYGRDFDFGALFFEQFFALRDVVPHQARTLTANENCDYCINADHNKNGYLIFNTTTSEDCMYGENVSYSRDTVDCTHTKRSELCYECVLCSDSYLLRFSYNCEECDNSWFLSNCRSCSHCICCSNLYRKKYCIFNQQATQAEYEAFCEHLDFKSYRQVQALQEKFKGILAKSPQPHMVAKRVQNSEGNILHNVRDADNSFLIFGGENLVNCFNLEAEVKDCLDFTAFGIGAELIFQTVRSGINVYRLSFCIQCAEGSSNLTYCTDCKQCEHCFGCSNLYRKRFCILNKQYTEAEYIEHVPKIIAHMQKTGEWGEFFPAQKSAMAYNHSVAQRYFPLSRQDAQARGFLWLDGSSAAEQGPGEAVEIPDVLPDQVQSLKVASSISQRPFLITAQEMDKYQRIEVPLPREHYEERIERRAKLLGGVQMRTAVCAKTRQQFNTVLSADTNFPIWHKEEYNREFFS